MYKVPNSVDWRTMTAYEIKAFDKYGLYGAPYVATRANLRNFSDLLGINGIWGWGTGNEPATGTTSGPRLFTPVASHARNYHDLDWDLTKPTDVVYYNVSGTPAQGWLDWNVVYQNWKTAGFKLIDASIQFGNSSIFIQSNWPNPYQNAYTYGKNYASNFGPSHKNLINVVEVGNEPWDYNADFYIQILEGMSKGFKDGDSQIRVAPGAFQADTPDYPPNGDGISWNGKYAGYRISNTALQSINVLNTHCYSYAVINGAYRGVRPEYPSTNFKGFRNMLRWRDANAPSSELWLTEWGWDGSSTCVDTRCVSLAAQSVYAVRGLLIGAREGIDRLTWFYYADGGDGSIVYDWSGVVTKPVNGVFTKKPVYYSFQNFLALLASYHHVAALHEGDDAYVYLLANAQGTLKIVAWVPVDGDVSTTEQTVAVSISGYSLSGTTFYEIGSATTGPATLATNKFTQSGTTFTMVLTGTPRVATVVAGTVASTITPTSAPTTGPTSCSPPVNGSGVGLRGDYYSGIFGSAVGVRIEGPINYVWTTSGPGISGLPLTSYSVRWSGNLLAKYSGAHTFYTTSDDGVTFSINGTSVISLWTAHSSTESTGTYTLVAGKSYPIVLEFYQGTGSSIISLSWSSSCIAKEIIPAAQLSPKALTLC